MVHHIREVREEYPDAVLLSNGYAYFVKSKYINGFNLGIMSLTPEGAWLSAWNHIRCM